MHASKQQVDSKNFTFFILYKVLSCIFLYAMKVCGDMHSHWVQTTYLLLVLLWSLGTRIIVQSKLSARLQEGQAKRKASLLLWLHTVCRRRDQ